MKNDTSPSSKSLDLTKSQNGTGIKHVDHVVDSIEEQAPSVDGANGAVTAKQNGTKQTNNEDKNDSEAETEIESGKEDGNKASKRKIKHEGKSDDAPNGHRKDHDTRGNGDRKKYVDIDAGGSGAFSLPSSAGKDPEASNSSILTSVHSSPSHEQSSRAPSETAPHSPSKTSVDSDTITKNSKRKRDSDETEAGEKRRVKREDSPASPPRQRSDTPPLRQRRRTLSAVSNSTPAHHHQHQQHQGHQPSRGRRKPPPIQTKTDDLDSDDSSNSRTHSYHRKSASVQKKFPQSGVNTSKYRDRNGRTLLAKACFSDTVDIVRERYHENPDHLDIKEYAENSPLQIAALRGEEDIVKFLVNQGANVNTQNIAKDTPLIDAVENGHVEVIRILLDAGANPSQPNGRGEEPLELIPEDDDDDDDTDAIRAILLEAKDKFRLRKPTDLNEQPTSGKSRGSAPIPSPKGSPSFHPGRSAADAGRSRRAQRGQSKRDDLLWIAATPARLQQAAGEGDAPATNHILSMGIPADSESVLAAAKGCHEDCLQFLMAFGSPEVADPDPIPGIKPGWDTPLLATIGQSGQNLSIIEILLGQKGFNPTRRLFKSKTYYEIARDRAGPNSEEEQRILRKAYEDYMREHGSPRKKKKPTAADSGPVRAVRQAEVPPPPPPTSRKDEARSRPSSDGKGRRRGSMERPSSSSSRLHAASLKHKSRESSVVPSDRERESSPSRRDKRRRISSSSEDEKVVTKQRKRLVTGKEKREGAERDRKRRASITSLDTPRSKLQDEVKAGRASASPARERKASDPASLQKLKRQRSEAQSLNEKSAQAKKPSAENSSDGKVESDLEAKKRKRDEEEAAAAAAAAKERERREKEQRRKEKEAADREIKAEAERKAAALQEQEEKKKRRKREEEEERERKRREEEEEAARKREEIMRREAEQARLREVQLQKDKARLPDGVYTAFHSHKSPPDIEDLGDWRNMRTVKSRNLAKVGLDAVSSDGSDSACEWLLNLQVAVVLGLKELSLSTHKQLADSLHVLLPQHLGLSCAGWWTTLMTAPQAHLESCDDYYNRVNHNRGKFAALAGANELFFIKRQVFDEVAAETKHLQDMELHYAPFAFYKSTKERQPNL